jgi:hypothetical protein
MCAPRVTRHTSIRYSSSCHTHVSMGASIFFTAAMIRAFRHGSLQQWRISYRRVPCHLGCTYQTSLVVKISFQFSCGCEQFHEGRSCGFLVISTWRSETATHRVTRHNTPIHSIISTAPQWSISQKTLGMLPDDGNVMPKHVGATIHN